MSAPTVTEREAVLRERAAWAQSRCAALHECHTGIDGDGSELPCVKCRLIAVRRFPLPKVTRPRVVRDPETLASWMVDGGALHFKTSGPWRRMLEHDGANGHWGISFDLTPKRVALWADLLANPTEEVEDVS